MACIYHREQNICASCSNKYNIIYDTNETIGICDVCGLKTSIIILPTWLLKKITDKDINIKKYIENINSNIKDFDYLPCKKCMHSIGLKCNIRGVFNGIYYYHGYDYGGSEYMFENGNVDSENKLTCFTPKGEFYIKI